MTYVIVVQDPNQTPDTLVGPFKEVEEAQAYMKAHADAFTDLESTIAEEWEGEGDIPTVQAFIVFMNPAQKTEGIPYIVVRPATSTDESADES